MSQVVGLDSPTVGAFRKVMRPVPGARELGQYWLQQVDYDVELVVGSLLLRLAHLEVEIERLSHLVPLAGERPE